MTAVLIEMAKVARAKAAREAERREQAFIEACEEIAETSGPISVEELIRRARLRVEAGR